MNKKERENTEVMVSEELFQMTEIEVEAMLSGILSESDSSSERRIDSIMKRVRVESVLKESADVLTEGIPSGLKGIADALKGIVKKDPEPPKRSY